MLLGFLDKICGFRLAATRIIEKFLGDWIYLVIKYSLCCRASHGLFQDNNFSAILLDLMNSLSKFEQKLSNNFFPL